MLTFIEGMDDCFDFKEGLNPTFNQIKNTSYLLKKQAYETF